MNEIITKIIDMAIEYGPKLIGAILIWIVGVYVIKFVLKLMSKMLDKRKSDDSLASFLKSLVNVTLKTLLIISVLSMLGIEMTSFVAILGAAGLAVGMALSGMLQNLAGGVIILLFKPFKVGDTIDAQGQVGTVKEIQIFNTILVTPDNKVIIVPNGGLSTSTMTNFSAQETRRVDWTVGIAYGDDIDKAKQIIRDLCNADSRILKDPEVFIGLSELASSSVNITIRAWVNAADYWGVFFDMNENLYRNFTKGNINIPYQQIDVHVKQ